MTDLERFGSTLAALDRLWEEYRSGWRRLLSRKMIAELELRASFDLDLLAPERIANSIPVGAVPDCANCDDICCSGLENVVSLRLRDVAVLMDLGRTDLISKKKPRFPPQMMTFRPALFELMGSELYQTLPVLRQVGPQRVCAALGPDNRCELYPNWPLSCERFPYILRSARRTVSWGRRCQFQQTGQRERSEEMLAATVATFNERVRDAVLLHHARKALDGLGIGAFLTDRDPFESPLDAPDGAL